jgi:hypothetical protein
MARFIEVLGWFRPLIPALAATVWALRPNMTRRMLITETAIFLVFAGAILVYSDYSQATLSAALVGARSSFSVWAEVAWFALEVVVVSAGAWIGWRVRQRLNRAAGLPGRTGAST